MGLTMRAISRIIRQMGKVSSFQGNLVTKGISRITISMGLEGKRRICMLMRENTNLGLKSRGLSFGKMKVGNINIAGNSIKKDSFRVKVHLCLIRETQRSKWRVYW